MTEIDYTFIYCIYHDEGCIITGNHTYVPVNYTMQHSNRCESCDWKNMGVIKYNGSSFDIIKSVTTNYDKYNGGFTFIGYINTLTDKNGNMIENDLLDKWIKDVSISISI